MEKIVGLFFGVFLMHLTVVGQKKYFPKLHTFEEVQNLQRKKKKPMVVFVYTKWCKFCYAMKKNTFTHPTVKKILDDSFYFVMLDAESKEEIRLQGRTFCYKQSGKTSGVHELATLLATKKGGVSYPTTVIISEANRIDEQVATFLNQKNFEELLVKYLKLYGVDSQS